MAKIQCTSKDVSGQTMTFPHIGKVTFDKDRTIEVPEELVEKFMALECGFKFKNLDGPEVPPTEEEVYKDMLMKAGQKNIADINVLIAEYPQNETVALRKLKDKVDYLAKKKFASENA